MCFIEIAIAASLTSTAVQTASSVKNAKYQAEVSRLQARNRQIEADNELALAGIDAQAEQDRGGRFLGEIDAANAASGFDANTGDAAAIRADAASIVAGNVENVMQRGRQRARALEIDAALGEAQAEAYESSITPTILGGAFSGVGSVARMWYGFRADAAELQDGDPTVDVPGSIFY